MMTIGTQHKLLIGLILILALLLTYRIANPLRPQTVAQLTYGRTNKVIDPQANAKTNKTPDRVTQINTNLLTSPPPLDLQVQRDPFRRPPPATVGPPPEPAAPQPAPPEVTPEARAREALGRFKVFGSFQQNDQTSLFLQRGKQVLIVNVGDRIDGQFKIEAIDGRTVVVAAPDLAAPITFEFEELTSDDNRTPPPVSGLPPSSAGAQPTSREFEMPPPEEEPEDFSPESSGDNPFPPLPEPPPIEEPTLPPSSTGSPSRDYLPGNKSREVD